MTLTAPNHRPFKVPYNKFLTGQDSKHQGRMGSTTLIGFLLRNVGGIFKFLFPVFLTDGG